MTSILGQARDSLRPARPPDFDTLVSRLSAVQSFLRAVDGQIPDDRLVTAHTLMERAGDRLSLSRDHTVVALAGSTGSGKSSLFNALAQLYFSPVGVHRPTTSGTYACVWGAGADATALLDWVGVLPRHRFLRESALDGNDEASMYGLVLLDLPDFDSVDRAHRVEVDRLLGLVDLMVWVVDPQKYADTVIHDSYLRQFRRHQGVTVVVLNHADRLTPADAQRCLADLRRLLADDGLPEVPAIATSAYQPEALVELRRLLERTVSGRQAALHRLAGDLDAVAAGMSGLVGPPAAEDAVDGGVEALADALAVAAGVPAVADATQRAYRHRAGDAMAWPPVRWVHRLRASSLRRGSGSAAAPAPAQRSAVNLALRTIADRAGQRLPEPWPAALTAAALSRVADLPDALDRTVGATGPNLLVRRHLGRNDPGLLVANPGWWRLFASAQWLAAAVALFGLLWLAIGLLLRLVGLPTLDYPKVGVFPLPTALLAGGLLAGWLLSLVPRPVVRFAARRAGARAEQQLRFAVAEVAREYVAAPVRDVLHRYAAAREALATAGAPAALAPTAPQTPQAQGGPEARDMAAAGPAPAPPLEPPVPARAVPTREAPAQEAATREVPAWGGR